MSRKLSNGQTVASRDQSSVFGLVESESATETTLVGGLFFRNIFLLGWMGRWEE